MGKMICFDLDGTLADLYSVPDWLRKLRAEDPSPYLEANPMWDMRKLREILLELAKVGWEIRVISWLAMNSSESYKDSVRKAKLEWLEEYDFPFEVAHLVQYGTTKANCVRKAADQAILVDDSKKVRDGWHLGETINPADGDLLEKLQRLVEGKPLYQRKETKMTNYGIVRRIDNMGQIAIPKEIRNALHLTESTPMVISVNLEGEIILRPYTEDDND